MTRLLLMTASALMTRLLLMTASALGLALACLMGDKSNSAVCTTVGAAASAAASARTITSPLERRGMPRTGNCTVGILVCLYQDEDLLVGESYSYSSIPYTWNYPLGA